MEKFEAANIVQAEDETPWDIVTHDLYGDGKHNNYYITASIVWGNIEPLYDLCFNNGATIISATLYYQELTWFNQGLIYSKVYSSYKHSEWVEKIIEQEEYSCSPQNAQGHPEWVKKVIAKENEENNVLIIRDLEKADRLQQEWIHHLVQAADSNFRGLEYYNPPKGKVKICLLWKGEPIRDIYEPLAREVMFIKL